MSTERFIEALNGDLKEYRGIPFWSWNNNLDEKELVRQIESMKKAGLGGFIMHARTGLNIEYLGEKWFSCIEACLKKAKELDMQAWIYDENGWPSGFVGGKLLENESFRARFLRYNVLDHFDENAVSVYKKVNDDYILIHNQEKGVKEYHTITIMVSPANTDILNPDVVDAFIKETHEQYYKRFKDSFGKELAGFFTDEPQYYRPETPYSPQAVKVYSERYNENPNDKLIYLFTDDEKGYEFRERYYQILNYLYANVYYKTLYNWCKAHNCMLTGHSVEEPSLFTQMWGGAGCMTSYEFEHIPAIDWLGRNCNENELSPKQIGSVASQLGKKIVLTETFGCSGYDVIPSELKSIGEYQYFNGVSKMCHHLYPYSVSGQGRIDFPPVFSTHNNWTEGFKSFNDYFAKLGYIISNTKDNYDVLIIHPMRAVYLNYIRSLDYLSIKDLEDNFNELLQKLRENGVQYQLADEEILKNHGKTTGDKIVIGNCEYDRVIVPDMKTLSKSTYDILSKYTGEIYLSGKLSYIDGKKSDINLKSNITFDDILNNTKVKFKCLDRRSFMTSRKSELGDFIFIKNSDRLNSSKVKLSYVAEQYMRLDLETLERSYITNDIELAPHDSLILIRDENAKVKAPDIVKKDITDSFKVTSISENYLVVDYGSISYDGVNFEEKKPLIWIFEELLRADYKGRLFVKQTFNVQDKMPLKLIVEQENRLSTTLNGKNITFTDSKFDVFYKECDITDLVKCGENQLVYELDYYQHDGVHFALFDPLATESLRNCLYYDTQIESIYIKGDFVIDDDHVIRKRKSLPEITDQLYLKGYPFFKGEVAVEGNYDYDGSGRVILDLTGRFVMVKADINGYVTDITLDTKKDITSYLKKGSNHIKLYVRSSLRNLFGPHHFKPERDPMSVSPFTFTMRGDWGNGKSSLYTDSYNSVPFGIKNISVIKETY